jgi:RNA polymerase sigma-70 factor (ECF subfamily)
VVNKCINQLKKQKIDLTFCETLPAIASEEEEETSFDTRAIFRGIEMLPDGYRIILSLYLLEGYDHAEISQILGISESTSKSQYSRAKDKLRNILSKKYNYGQS